MSTGARWRALSLTTGSLDPSFNARGVNGVVKDMRLVSGQLYVAGLFSQVSGQAQRGLASLSPTTGGLTGNANLAFSGTQNGGTTNILKMDVTPAGDRMLVIGNFTSVAGLARRQVALLDLTTPSVTVSPWDTTFFTSTCSLSFDTYMRDVDISEDGTFAIFTTTGAYRANTSCDTNSRLALTTETSGVTPTWINYTGGDTSYAVEIHAGVAYVGGHMRWANNNTAADQAGAGRRAPGGRAGPRRRDRPALQLEPWARARRRAVRLPRHPAGIWAGSDTDRWANELHQRLAFFPWAPARRCPPTTSVCCPTTSTSSAGPPARPAPTRRCSTASTPGAAP